MRQGCAAGLLRARRTLGFAVAGALALVQAACTDTLPQLQANAPEAQVQGRIAARPGVSPSGATVAFVNVSGAPDTVAARFATAMSQALGARKISPEDAGKANYLIRGHLTAVSGDGGTIIAYVWDIYGSDRRRRQRLEDEIAVKGQASDPWSLVDEKVLSSIAGRSADDIAAFLTNMPEAIAASGAGARTGAQASLPAPSQPLAYAPIR